MSQNGYPGAAPQALAQQFSQHGTETIHGLIGLAQMRQQAARDHVARLEAALSALDYFAQMCLETRALYIQQIESDQVAINQFADFATTQLPFLPPSPAAPLAPEAAGMTPDAFSRRLSAVAPVARALTQQTAPMQASDAEGRRPVDRITPEMRDQWRAAPPVQVKVARPGDEEYVPQAPVNGVSQEAMTNEAGHVGTAERQSE